jgi:glycine betaine/proline transport system ATP-binding protein
VSTITVNGVYKVFGNRPERAREPLERGRSKDEIHEDLGLIVAVQDATFEVDDGELFVIMGLSGSGKSTLVRLINRLIEPTWGSVEIGGEDVTSMSKKRLREVRTQRISMVFQHFALFPHMKVWENAAYGLEVRGVGEDERRERAETALERVGLSGWGGSYPRNLSGGMQQRVGLARGLATDAPILLMDEPFSALDPLIRRDMQDLLAELQRELQRTIVFITHDLNEAMRLGDRIAVLRDGAIVQVGTGAEIIAEPANEYVADFVADVDRSRVITADLVMREPQATVHPDDTPRSVLEKLEGLEQNGIYCIGDGGEILGVARDDRAAEAVGSGKRVRDILVQRYAKVPPGTPLLNVSALSARDSVPVAVVDESDRLLGVVPRAALLAALAPDISDSEEELRPAPGRLEVEEVTPDA